MNNNQMNLLNNQMNNLSINNNANGMVYRNQMIGILIKSIDQKVQLPCAVHITDIFADIEKLLYKEFPELRFQNTYFTVKGNTIKRFLTIQENNIKNYDIILLNIIE